MSALPSWLLQTTTGNVWDGTVWFAEVPKGPYFDGNTVAYGDTPNTGWSVANCGDGTYVCGLAFTHKRGENLASQKSFSLRCCAL